MKNKLRWNVMMLCLGRMGFLAGCGRNMAVGGGVARISRRGVGGADPAAVYGWVRYFSSQTNADGLIQMAVGFSGRFMQGYQHLSVADRAVVRSMPLDEFVGGMLDIAMRSMEGVFLSMNGGAGGVCADRRAFSVAAFNGWRRAAEAAVNGGRVAGVAGDAADGAGDGDDELTDGAFLAWVRSSDSMLAAARLVFEFGRLRGSSDAGGLGLCVDLGVGEFKEDNYRYLFSGADGAVAVSLAAAIVGGVREVGLMDGPVNAGLAWHLGDVLIGFIRGAINSPFLVSDVMPKIVHYGVVVPEGVRVFCQISEKELNRSVEVVVDALRVVALSAGGGCGK